MGYIGEVKRFCCHYRPLAGETLVTTLTLEAEAGGVILLSAQTHAGSTLAATTQMKIFIA